MPDIKKYLNRDGLDEYNSLLPHSSAEMQTYVNEWMNEHPEASTTVQDGAITEPKLADKSVSLRTLADDTVHMLKGAILTGKLSGNVLTADDAYSAPPVALAIEGKSTQDGTPTPDAPVEIVSVENPVLTFAGKNLFDISKVIRTSANVTVDGTTITTVGGSRDIFTGSAGVSAVVANLSKVMHLPAGTYTISCGKTNNDSVGLDRVASDGTVANIAISTASSTLWVETFTLEDATYLTIRGTNQTITNLQIEVGSTATAYQPYDGTSVLLNLTQALRSLPDGTHDTLSFAYLRPSTREGWAWYSQEITQRIGTVDMGTLTWGRQYAGLPYEKCWATVPGLSSAANGIACLCSHYRATTTAGATANMSDKTICKRLRYPMLMIRDTDYSSGPDLKASLNGVYVQYPLATPITTQLDPIELPVLPEPDVTVWCDPSTGLQIEYVRDSNIVIQNIEQAIADQ